MEKARTHKPLPQRQAKRYRSPVDATIISQFRGSPEWKRLRALKRGLQPLCEDPFEWHARERRSVAASSCHHIVGLDEDITQGLVLENLMSTCSKCHARLEADVRQRQGQRQG